MTCLKRFQTSYKFQCIGDGSPLRGRYHGGQELTLRTIN